MDELEGTAMSEPWDALKDEVLSLLEEGVRDIASEVRPALQEFLREAALRAAKEKWRSLNAASQEERDIAESNLRHLRGQVVAEARRQQLALTSSAETILAKVLDVVLGALVRIVPRLLERT